MGYPVEIEGLKLVIEDNLFRLARFWGKRETFGEERQAQRVKDRAEEWFDFF